MVAPHRPGSDSAVSRHRDGRVPGGFESRPWLRLVVDNTVAGVESPSPRNHRPPEVAGPPTTLAAECVAWMRAAAGLASARWRLARQQWINRYGHLAMGDRMAGFGPAVVLAVVCVFGGLFALRLAQEGPSTTLPAPSSAVASAIAAPGPENSTSIGFESARTNGGGDPAMVVVHPGDSLWSIAVDRFPDRDPRSVVDAFVEVNGGSAISPGQQLVVPVDLIDN